GSEDQQARWLPAIADGSSIATLCFTNRHGHAGPDGIGVTIAPAQNGYLLSGEAGFVPFGHAADLLVVAARGSSGDALDLVVMPADTPGISRERLVAM